LFLIRSQSVANIRAANWFRKIYFLLGKIGGVVGWLVETAMVFNPLLVSIERIGFMALDNWGYFFVAHLTHLCNAQISRLVLAAYECRGHIGGYLGLRLKVSMVF